jgi:hypothetical protein
MTLLRMCVSEPRGRSRPRRAITARLAGTRGASDSGVSRFPQNRNGAGAPPLSDEKGQPATSPQAVDCFAEEARSASTLQNCRDSATSRFYFHPIATVVCLASVVPAPVRGCPVRRGTSRRRSRCDGQAVTTIAPPRSRWDSDAVGARSNSIATASNTERRSNGVKRSWGT